MKILRYLFRPLSSGCAAVSCALLFTACIEVDYDFGGHAPEPQVTINALLTPQEEFTVSLHWSGIYTDEIMTFKPVSEAEIRLFEDGREVVRCTASPQGATNTGFLAATGRRYRLRWMFRITDCCQPRRTFLRLRRRISDSCGRRANTAISSSTH